MTWIKVLGAKKIIISQGVENVTLSILNITRHQSGMYECQATNNPNAAAIKRRMEIMVMRE
jgi:hypothetical protein